MHNIVVDFLSVNEYNTLFKYYKYYKVWFNEYRK